MLSRSSDESSAVRDKVIEYLARTGLSTSQFAYRVGYSKSAIKAFLGDRYEEMASSDNNIVRACVSFMSSNPIRFDLEIEGHLHDTSNVKIMRNYFKEALDKRCSYYLRGAPGTQKSHVLQHLIAENNCREIKNGNKATAFYIYSSRWMTPLSVVREVAKSVGSFSTGSSIQKTIANIAYDLRDRKTILVFDEAQSLTIDCLETIRGLLDQPPHCGLIFAGSHRLYETFERLDMEQWRSRLRKGPELPGLSEQEAESIFRFELEPLVGSISAKKMSKLIQACYTRDMRKVSFDGGKPQYQQYISARLLFDSIKKYKDELAKANRLKEAQ
jgi:DNA transposition AAA+ family ATPase